MSELVARTGRQQQRYEDGYRLIAGYLFFSEFVFFFVWHIDVYMHGYVFACFWLHVGFSLIRLMWGKWSWFCGVVWNLMGGRNAINRNVESFRFIWLSFGYWGLFN